MKFEQTNFYKLWASMEGRNIMRAILNNPELIKPNYTFWMEKFRVDPNITPSDSKGVASFTSYMRENDNGVMMDMRAPLSDTMPVDKKGGRSYSGTIPDFSARGYVETATERMYREEFFNQFSDAKWIAEFATSELQRMLNAGNQTLSHQAAELLSTGKITYNLGEGIHAPVLKADIPAENFLKAGKAVWSNPTTKIISQMIEIQDKIESKLQPSMSFQWEVTKKMWDNLFMKNEQVLEYARYIHTLDNGTTLPNSYVFPSDMIMKALSRYEGLAPIVIIEEKQKDINKGVVSGWKDNVAVYRPVGYAGFIRRSTILDEKAYKRYGNNLNFYSFTEALYGCGVFMNSTIVNGNFKEWHTDLFMKAVPTLDEFLYHYIIDTATAD